MGDKIQVQDAVLEVIEGDARNVLCEAVDRHHASVLVVGSHGYGAIKRYFSTPSQINLMDQYFLCLYNN